MMENEEQSPNGKENNLTWNNLIKATVWFFACVLIAWYMNIFYTILLILLYYIVEIIVHWFYGKYDDILDKPIFKNKK